MKYTDKPDLPIPGHKNSSVHRRGVIPGTRNLVVTKVFCPTIFFILPLTEALQRSLSMMPNGQLRLWGGEKKKEILKEKYQPQSLDKASDLSVTVNS